MSDRLKFRLSIGKRVHLRGEAVGRIAVILAIPAFAVVFGTIVWFAGG